MKKLSILIGSFTALLLISSCSADSIDESEPKVMTEDMQPPPPPVDHGGNDKDKDKG